MTAEVFIMWLRILEFFLTTGTLTLAGFMWRGHKKRQAMRDKKDEEHRQEHCDLRDSQRDQLQYQIVMAFRIFNEQGCISLHEKQMFDNLCKRYYALGGNSFVHSLQEKVDQLPIID